MNTFIRYSCFDSNLIDNVENLSPVTKDLSIKCKKRNKKKCNLLNRLLLEDSLEIKMEQETLKVKTWEELKFFSEARFFYDRYKKSNQKKCLEKAYIYCSDASEMKNKIFFSLFYNIAIDYFEIGVFDRAEEMFNRANDIKHFVNAHSGRGICLRYRLRHREAMNEFKHAISHENTLASLTPREAAKSKLEGRKALECFDYKFTLSTSWDLFGGIYLDLGCYASDLYDKAIIGFYEAIRRDYTFPYAWLWLGVVFYRKGALFYKKAEIVGCNFGIINQETTTSTERDPIFIGHLEFIELISKAQKYVDLGQMFIEKAIKLGKTYGYKYFCTSPTGMAACLLLSSIKIPK